MYASACWAYGSSYNFRNRGAGQVGATGWMIIFDDLILAHHAEDTIMAIAS